MFTCRMCGARLGIALWQVGLCSSCLSLDALRLEARTGLRSDWPGHAHRACSMVQSSGGDVYTQAKVIASLRWKDSDDISDRHGEDGEDGEEATQ